MTPGDRTMPVVVVVPATRRVWLVTLPDGRVIRCPSRASVHRTVDKNACGAAIRWASR